MAGDVAGAVIVAIGLAFLVMVPFFAFFWHGRSRRST